MMRRLLPLRALLVSVVIGLTTSAFAQTLDRSPPPVLNLRTKGKIRALVVGIDKYPNLPSQVQLDGAVADARDISDALKRAGVIDITFLLDTEATRATFTASMAALTSNASVGDLVIVTFAGHGMQENERIPGSKPDGKNEEFILSLIGREGASTAERILDDEIFDWFKRIASKGADIIFVADSCHGGGMTKATSRGSVRRGVRGITRVYSETEASPAALYIAPGEDRLAIPASIAPTDNATFDIPSLTFLAGVDAWSEVIEITIEGKRRGAMSYAFARALDGSRPSGDITREKLFRSVHQQVLQLSEHKQSPVMEPRTPESAKRVLFRKVGGALADPISNTQLPDAKIVTLEDGETAPSPQGYYAFWDKKTGDVISETRSVLAYGVPQSQLQTVAKRVGVTSALTQIAAQIPLQADLSPREKDYQAGQKFKLIIEGVYGRYIAIVNLAGNGEVQYLFPTGNTDPLILDDRLEIPMHAASPFGTDTLIVLASKNRQRNLEQDLALLDTQANPDGLLRAIRDRLENNDLLGVISYSSRP